MTPTIAVTWTWIAVLVLATISIHVLGIALIAWSVRRFWSDDVDRELTFFDSGPGVIAIIVVTAFTLAVFHAVEVLIWATAYLKLGTFSSMTDAMLYSMGSMTTRGSSGFRLQPSWSLMGAAEAGDGMLLFGISTAFLFTLMVRLRKSVTRPS